MFIWSDHFQFLAETDNRCDDAYHSNSTSLAFRLVQVVTGNKYIQYILQELNHLPLYHLAAIVHVQQLSLVLALHHNHRHLGQTLQSTHYVLPLTHHHALGLVSGGIVLADDLDFTQKNSMVEEVEENCEEMLEDDQNFNYKGVDIGSFLDECSNFLANFSWMFDSS